MSTNKYIIALDNKLDTIFMKDIQTDIWIIIAAIILFLIIMALILFVACKMDEFVQDLKFKYGRKHKRRRRR